ncbi:MAG: hypothetical protein ABIK62_06750 [candidate division WOR-3 bacterium]
MSPGPRVPKALIPQFVRRVLEIVPAHDDDLLKRHIDRLAPISTSKPDLANPLDKCYPVGDWFFCLRRFPEPNLQQNFLEIWPGTAGAFWGFLRLNPYFHDDQGRDRKIWELAHAYVSTKYRGLGINALYVALTLELARVNRADLVVANPRHVSMLITLTENGFHIRGTSAGLQAIRRTIRQGRNWYRKDISARRMYYAEELRGIMQDGSLMMEKELKGSKFWELSLFGINLRPRKA